MQENQNENLNDDLINEPDNQPEITIAEPKAKKRGRPRKDAAEAPKAETLSTDEKPARKRTARKGNSAQFAQQIIGLHKMVAMLPNMQFMELEQQEAAILAEAMQGVAEEYNVAVGGKTGATINLIMAGAMIYGPRFVYFSRLKKSMRARDITPKPEDDLSAQPVAAN